MDKEIANTLGELERKLRELERVLGGIERRATPAPAQDDRARGQRCAHRRSPPRPAPARPWPVDRRARSTLSPLAPATAEPAVGQRPGHASASPHRLADAGPAGYAPVRRGGRRASDHAPDADSGQAGLAGADEPTHRPVHRPPPPAEQTPSAAELLRFRDRLERTARELTHDYDELLGRISYAAVPTPTGPTISFARGAPSLDIVDVEGLRDAAGARVRERPGRHDGYGTSIGYPPLRAGSPTSTASSPSACSSPTARCRPTRSCSSTSSRRRRGRRRAPDLRPHAAVAARARRATCTRSSCEPDGIDTRRARARCSAPDGVRPKLAHIIPNFQNPAGYTLSLRQARRRCSSWPREHGFVVFEDDPYVALRFSGEALPTMLSHGPGARRLRVVVLEDRLPGHPRRLPRRAAGADRRRSPSWRRTPTSRRTWSRRRSSTSSAPRARSSARSRPSRRRWPSASPTLAAALRRASCPRRSSSRPRAATSCG